MTALGSLVAGRYRLDEEIGRGGMSTVYRAFDEILERPVAIKLMHREIAAESDQLERFRREARAVAQLNHPHIVSVIDAGEERPEGDGDQTVAVPYIVLEYVPGETLKSVIRREGRIEITTALAYAIEIARALGAAHDRQIVHRDVKPHNILLDEEGGAKITDFGIARSLAEESLTMTGRVLGTTDYVSPEQALGQPVTGQSDIYSLGVVLYEMLTGDVPFHADSPVAVAMMHVRDQPPDIRESRPELAAATAAAVERAMAKEPVERYADAAAMAASLEDVLAVEMARTGQAAGEVTSVLRTLPEGKRRRLPLRLRSHSRWVAIVVVAAIVVAGAVFAIVRATNRGTGPPASAGQGLVVVPLQQNAATAYNPFGTGPENRDLAGNVVDGDPNTSWSSEEYYDGNLQEAGRHRARDLPERRTGFGRQGDAGLDADAGLHGERLRREQPQPRTSLRRPGDADAAWLGGPCRREPENRALAAHHPRPRWSPLQVLPAVGDGACAERQPGDALRTRAAALTLRSSSRRGARGARARAGRGGRPPRGRRRRWPRAAARTRCRA